MIPKNNCLYCDGELYANKSPDKLEKGIFIICAHCGGIMQCNEKLILEIPVQNIPNDVQQHSNMIKMLVSQGYDVKKLVTEYLENRAKYH
jgi:transcription elongation factor Elf1